MENIKLSEHFTYKKLLRFVMPSIIMMVFVSVYGIVDGFFVSNFVGEIQFAAINLIYPFIMILGAVGFMFGAGGNAIVSKVLGEGDGRKANRLFSLFIYVTMLSGVILAALGIAFAKPVAELFAMTEKSMNAAEKQELIKYCVQYARIILATLPAFMLQNAFQGSFVTAEKPRLGLWVTVIAGCGNIVFDALFVPLLKWGLVGAAVATAISQLIGGALPVLYFTRKNGGVLQLGKAELDIRTLCKACGNGLSELMTNVSFSIVTILYNTQLMRFEGINGVSAYGVVMYVGFIFISVFIGYSVGSSPIIGYHFGAKNDKELKSILRKSVVILLMFSVIMTLTGIVFAKPLSMIFVSGNVELLKLATFGMRTYSLCFLAAGINIFASSFFTALSNGVVSLIISFSRTLLLQIICVLVLPIWFGLNGIWFSNAVAELLALAITIFFIFLMRKKYGYL